MGRKKKSNAPMTIPNPNQIEYWKQKGYSYLGKNQFKDRVGYISIFRIDFDKTQSMFTDMSMEINHQENKSPIYKEEIVDIQKIKVRKERSDKGKKRGSRK